MNDNNTAKPSSSERIRELKMDSTLWATAAKIINLFDFKPEKLSIDTEINTNTNGEKFLKLLIMKMEN